MSAHRDLLVGSTKQRRDQNDCLLDQSQQATPYLLGIYSVIVQLPMPRYQAPDDRGLCH